MNQFDRDNFVWYTNASEEELEQWYEEADVSDLQYMVSLIQEELTNLRLQELQVLDAVEDFGQAKTLLKKFTLEK